MASQRLLFEKGAKPTKTRASSTFQENLRLPIHRWFRYSAGFSALWTNQVIREFASERPRVLDPFAGSGTVPLEAETRGAASIGVEAHPFVARVASAKLLWHRSPRELMSGCDALLAAARAEESSLDDYPVLVRKCFPDGTLSTLSALKAAWQELGCAGGIKELLWLGLVSILRQCSPVGTANWQYVLPKKTKSRVSQPRDAFRARIVDMADDMRARQEQGVQSSAQLLCEDARELASVPDGWAQLVLTSPPYPNNFDYADATRLEQSFLGEVRGWGELQGVVRKHLVRSCSQHVQSSAHDTEAILSDQLLSPIADEIVPVCQTLGTVRLSHGGNKAYHTMVAAYFLDMARVWRSLRRVTARGGDVCFVIGDSAPYGVYVPVEQWMGKLALASGFQAWRFEKIRDRNVKWKNRKHRIPLQEGRLWVKG